LKALLALVTNFYFRSTSKTEVLLKNYLTHITFKFDSKRPRTPLAQWVS